MVYDWDVHEELCYRMYIDEKRPLEDIMKFLKVHHKFSPSKRAFQTQFRRWEFPSKQNPAHKNERLVARIRELWERNLPQREMLRILTEEDGFDIKQRELMRVRTRNRWLLRVPNDKSRTTSESPTPADAESDLPSESAASGDPSDCLGENAPAQLCQEGAARKQERLRQLEADSAERWASKKRRRRTRAWAGLPADPPGPPRFPSETTIDESKLILGLDNHIYRDIRATFQAICEEADVERKTTVGPEKWELTKERLIHESPHLQSIMWLSPDNSERKKLALDVICTDVTKRIRTLGRRMNMADAKNILGTNPQESREIRQAFGRILRDDHFTSKVEAGPDHWSELKWKWIGGSAKLKQLLVQGDGEHSREDREKALEVLARDVMKRLRDEQTRRDRKEPAQSASHSQLEFDVAMAELHDDDAFDEASYDQAEDTTPMSQMSLLPSTPHDAVSASLSVTLHGSPHDLQGQGQARMLGPSVMDPTTGLPLTSQLGSSLLLGSDTQAAFMDQQYVHPFAPAQATQVFHAHPTALNTIAIYLRGHTASTYPVDGELWIATLSPPTVDELRQTAVEKYPGAICLAVEGIVKDGKGGELPLKIEQDQHLAAYLHHVVNEVPLFNVQLVHSWKTS